jgi:transaldolase
MNGIGKLKVKIFCDGANIADLKALSRFDYIKGFTTNPTLMHKSGVLDYENFIKEALTAVRDKPISFEVISDDFDEMERQGKRLSSFGGNIYVKIPITNTQGKYSFKVIANLLNEGVKVNVTAIMSLKQVSDLRPFLKNKTPAIVSIF